MNTIGVGLCVSDSVAAVKMYTKAFGLTLGYHVLNDDGTYFHSELYKGDEEVLDVVQAPTPKATDIPVQLGFVFDDKDALVRAYELLCEGGRTLMELCSVPWSDCCVEVEDRFGVRWFLTLPMHQPSDDFNPKDMK